MKPDFARSFLWLGVAFVLSSCAKDSDPSAQSELINTRWMLEQVENIPIMVSSHSEDYKSYLEFSATGNQTRGLAGCDEIEGQYSLVNSTRQLTFSQLSVKPGNCGGPIMAARYIQQLPQVTRYELEGAILRLYDAQGANPKLTFRASK
ncbi:META domain-containing protein [Hymenobacter sp. HD11105]